MKRHSTDLASLAFGLIFAGIAGWWLVGRYIPGVHVSVPYLGLILAGALIVLGLLGVAGSLRRERRSNDAAVNENDGAVNDAVAASDPDTTDAALPDPAEPVGPETAELPHPLPRSETDDRPY
ncbi:MAG: hypothetical protein QOE61_3751 [Micromonosporaceae bacterium]|jgi:hypothetical protein|nr:hypothetical protein [Micromonosporaceae bacterium]